MSDPSIAGSRDAIVSTQYVLSKRRWAFLFAISVFSFTSSLCDNDKPILTTMLELVGLSLDQYIYISQIFIYVPVFMSMPTAMFVDKYGLRMTMYAATLLMLLRNTSKALLFSTDIPMWPQLKMVYWVVSTIASMQMVSLFYCMPLKISESWFGESERSLAWVVIVTSADIGESLGSFMLPRFVQNAHEVKPLAYLNIACAFITIITTLTCVTRSQPKFPPSARSTRARSRPRLTWASLKLMLKSKQLMMHTVYAAIFRSGMIPVAIVMQTILISSGHDKVFIGNLMSVSSLTNMFAIIFLSLFVHKARDITLMTKMSASLVVLLFIAKYWFYVNPHIHEFGLYAIAAVAALCFAWFEPNNMNMCASLASGVVSEATISGVGIMLTTFGMSISQIVFVALVQTDKKGHEDYTRSMIFVTLLIGINLILYLIFFKGPDKKSSADGDNVAAAAARQQDAATNRDNESRISINAD